jgi:hypothetical protein
MQNVHEADKTQEFYQTSQYLLLAWKTVPVVFLVSEVLTFTHCIALWSTCQQQYVHSVHTQTNSTTKQKKGLSLLCNNHYTVSSISKYQVGWKNVKHYEDKLTWLRFSLSRSTCLATEALPCYWVYSLFVEAFNAATHCVPILLAWRHLFLIVYWCMEQHSQEQRERECGGGQREKAFVIIPYWDHL